MKIYWLEERVRVFMSATRNSKLFRIQKAMEDEMRKITLAEAIKDTQHL